MIATDRLHEERHFHDRQAIRRSLAFQTVDSLIFRDETYLHHETWIEPAMRRLGPLPGRRVLDYGCGHGMASVVLARRGAVVTGFDLSAGYIAEASRRAFANEASATFLQADAHSLPFADASFDAIWGNAVLHHLDLAIAAREIRRVLRPGGVAVFCEPWGGNPVLEWARRHAPYRGKERTRDEEPLRPDQVETLAQIFPGLKIEGAQLFAMIHRLVPIQAFTALLSSFDGLILDLAPGLKKYCRYVVLTFRRC